MFPKFIEKIKYKKVISNDRAFMYRLSVESRFIV